MFSHSYETNLFHVKFFTIFLFSPPQFRILPFVTDVLLFSFTFFAMINSKQIYNFMKGRNIF